MSITKDLLIGFGIPLMIALFGYIFWKVRSYVLEELERYKYKRDKKNWLPLKSLQ